MSTHAFLHQFQNHMNPAPYVPEVCILITQCHDKEDCSTIRINQMMSMKPLVRFNT